METIDKSRSIVPQPEALRGAVPAVGGAAAGAEFPMPRRKSCAWLLDAGWVWEAFGRHRGWGLVCAMVLAVAGSMWGFRSALHTAKVSISRDEGMSRATGNTTAGSWARLGAGVVDIEQAIAAPAVLERASQKAGVTIDYLAAHSELVRVGNSGAVQLRLSGHERGKTLKAAQALSEEALRYCEETKSEEVKRFGEQLKKQLSHIDQALEVAAVKISECIRGSGFIDLEKGTSTRLQEHQEYTKRLEELRIQKETLDLQVTNLYRIIAQHHPALLAAKQALDQALLRYTEEHPKVQELRTNMATIELRIARQSAQGDPEVALNGSSLAQGLYSKVIELRNERMSLEKQWQELSKIKESSEWRLAGLSQDQLAYAKAKSEYESLRQTRQDLARVQNENELAGESQGAGHHISQPAALDGAGMLGGWRAGMAWGAGAGVLGLIAAGCLIALVEISDRRIRSAGELARITRLPVWATLGDLREMDGLQRREWAFRTLILLQGKLTGHSGQAMVCAFSSSRSGEGRSTWVQLLAEAAKERGYRTITLVCNEPCKTAREPKSASDPASSSEAPMILPHDITRKALSTEMSPIVEIPLSAWAWDLTRRAQWLDALNQLKSMENLVVLVELPPAATPETTLLAENLSPVIWLCGKDRCDAAETVQQLETLRNARAQVAGTVFNAGASSGARKGLGRALAVFLAAGLLAFGVGAQEVATLPPAISTDTNPPMSLSVSSPSNLAEWQKRLTLGPGDVLQVGLYGQPETMRGNLAIGPDGRLNYLQARDLVATGLTVDELRDQLEKVLLKFYRPPLRVVVIPQSYRSKKYYLLGNVTQPGVFPLDHPVSVIEAIAGAGGFVTTIQRRNSLMLADLSRSFLIRKEAPGEFKRVDVNFESLFLKGDLGQNIALAPDDYLFFSPQDLPEVYVLGHVLRPGASPYITGMTAIKAIAAQGGFTGRAWKGRVLIVRGSLSKPQTFVLDVSDVLAAKSLDFKLEPRDIVFVARKPWARAEELLEIAITDFVRAVVITYTGAHVGPWITEPIFR